MRRSILIHFNWQDCDWFPIYNCNIILWVNQINSLWFSKIFQSSSMLFMWSGELDFKDFLHFGNHDTGRYLFSSLPGVEILFFHFNYFCELLLVPSFGLSPLSNGNLEFMWHWRSYVRDMLRLRSSSFIILATCFPSRWCELGCSVFL